MTAKHGSHSKYVRGFKADKNKAEAACVELNRMQKEGKNPTVCAKHLSIKVKKLVSVPLDESARLRAYVLPVLNHLHPVDENFRDSGCQLAGLLKSGVVLDGVWIEDRNVRKVSLSQQTAMGNTEVGCRETGHLANGFRHGYDFFIAD